MAVRRAALAVAGVTLVPLLVWGLWVGWNAWSLRSDLGVARGEVAQLRDALAAGDLRAAERTAEDLQVTAARAADRTDGTAWTTATWVPWLGDDARALRAMATSLDEFTADGVRPLLRSSADLDAVVADGGIDLEVVQGLRAPVRRAADAAARAERTVSAASGEGLTDGLGSSFDDYVEQLTGLSSTLDAARVTTELLPRMAGADGSRRYLVLVQNNAEIRGTGGLPGAYLVLTAEDGRLGIESQGSPQDLPTPLPEPVLPLTPSELAVYDTQLGTYFGDAGFTPDFPRAAELAAAHWERSNDEDLDGVMAVDPVSLGYLLDSLPPVEVDGRRLTPDTVAEELLSRPYRGLDPDAQDELFAEAARDVFQAVIDGPVAAPGLLQGLARAGREGRLLVAPFRAAEAEELAGTRVAGEAGVGDGAGRRPRVDVALNDATGSKMSYYLRYDTSVVAEGCRDGGQRLAGSMVMRSTIRPREAATLPVSVTGGGAFGTRSGEQLVLVRVLGPYGGTLDRVRIDGTPTEAVPVDLAGRPVVTVPVLLTSRDPVELDWQMRTREGQTGDVDVRVTPGIVPGDAGSTVPSSC